MNKVVKSRKAKRLAYLVALAMFLTSYLGVNATVAYAQEPQVGDVLYVEGEDNYVQEDITEEDKYKYPEDTEKTEDKKEETKQEDKTEDKKQESVADSLEDLDKDQFIDADTPIGDDSTVGEELDKSETEGEKIPDDVEDEVDKKDLDPDPEPEPEPEPDPEPEPEPDPEPDPEPEPEPEPEPDIPKMADDNTRYCLLGAAGAAVVMLLNSIKKQIQNHRINMAAVNGNKVISSKKKYRKRGKKLSK